MSIVRSWISEQLRLPQIYSYRGECDSGLAEIIGFPKRFKNIPEYIRTTSLGSLCWIQGQLRPGRMIARSKAGWCAGARLSSACPSEITDSRRDQKETVGRYRQLSYFPMALSLFRLLVLDIYIYIYTTFGTRGIKFPLFFSIRATLQTSIRGGGGETEKKKEKKKRGKYKLWLLNIRKEGGQMVNKKCIKKNNKKKRR